MKLSLPKVKKPNLKFASGLLGGAQKLEKSVSSSAKTKLHIDKTINRGDKTLAAISYIFIAGFIVRWFRKERSSFLDYHERQSITLLVLLAFFLLIPDYGFTVFGPLIVLFMVLNIIVSAFGGTIKLIPN